LKKVYGQFKNALYNDLDSPKALAILFDFVRDTHARIDAGEPIPRRHVEKMLQRMERVLALNLFIIDTIPQEVTELATKRQQARQDKNYDLSDQLRDQINQLGYIVKDTPQGFEITKK
jgi:cysteinyl-tRNA synthetase